MIINIEDSLGFGNGWRALRLAEAIEKALNGILKSEIGELNERTKDFEHSDKCAIHATPEDLIIIKHLALMIIANKLERGAKMFCIVSDFAKINRELAEDLTKLLVKVQALSFNKSATAIAEKTNTEQSNGAAA